MDKATIIKAIVFIVFDIVYTIKLWHAEAEDRKFYYLLSLLIIRIERDRARNINTNTVTVICLEYLLSYNIFIILLDFLNKIKSK